jgi:hypothetical protein
LQQTELIHPDFVGRRTPQSASPAGFVRCGEEY